MASSGQTLTKQSIVDDFVARIRNPAFNSVVFWNGNFPANRINTAALGPRDFSATLSTGNLTGNITAATILSLVKTYARFTTAARRATSGLLVDNFSPDTAGFFIDQRTDICRLTDAYLIDYSYTSDSNLQSGNTSTAPGINAFYDAVRSVAANAQTTAGVVDLRICHSSCHSSCHGSRGRR
jgi:hypothetical protein